MTDSIAFKLPGSFDGAPWQPSKSGYLFKFIVPKEYHSRVKPLTGFEDRYAVIAIVFCDSKQQADYLLAEKVEDSTSLPNGEEERLKDVMTAEELAQLFMVDDRTIRLWHKMGIIPKEGQGRYLAYEAIQGRLRHLDEQAKGKGTNDYQQERAKRAAILREQEEISLLERKRLLIPGESVKKGIVEYLGVITNRLKALPSEAETPEEQEKLERTVRECCFDLARVDVGKIISRLNEGDMGTTKKAQCEPVGRGRKSPKPKDKRRARKVAKRKNPVSC